MQAEQALDRAPADTPAYRRMTNAERLLILKLHEDNLTQAEIAQRVGRAQSSISDLLDTFTDSTALATRFLRASAFRMAENVVENGEPRDHNVALAGIEVLSKQEAKGGLTIVIGSGSAVQINVGPVDTCVTIDDAKSLGGAK